MRQDLEEKGWTELATSNRFKIGTRLFEEMKRYFPYRELGKIKIPTVIIHGDSDSYVPYEDSIEYIKSIPAKTELITIKGEDHGFGGENDRQYKKEAIEKTAEIFRKYL